MWVVGEFNNKKLKFLWGGQKKGRRGQELLLLARLE